MKTVKELMVPLGDYTQIFAEDSLFEAIAALERAQKLPESDPDRPRDRAVLVIDQAKRVVGKLSMWDVLRGLEPQYDRPIDPLAMPMDYGLWSKPFINLAEKAREIKAKDLIRLPVEEECITEEATLDQAVNRLIRKRQLSLLVTRNGDIVGILRLSDVFREVSAMIRASRG